MEKLLRIYQHVARQEHWCDQCCTYIQPGEMYEGRIYVSETHGLYTFKIHIHPECDLPEDPDDDKTNDNEDINDLEHEVNDVRRAA